MFLTCAYIRLLVTKYLRCLQKRRFIIKDVSRSGKINISFSFLLETCNRLVSRLFCFLTAFRINFFRGTVQRKNIDKLIKVEMSGENRSAMQHTNFVGLMFAIAYDIIVCISPRRNLGQLVNYYLIEINSEESLEVTVRDIFKLFFTEL